MIIFYTHTYTVFEKYKKSVLNVIFQWNRVQAVSADIECIIFSFSFFLFPSRKTH